MSTIPPFSSVPGQLYPGEGQPGLVGQGGASAYFPYYGHMPLIYLDYLNAGTGETLVAFPGGSYLMMPVNSRRGLTVPPPDGRWNPSTVKDFIVWHPPGSAAWDREAHRSGPGKVAPQPSLAEVRVRIEAAKTERGFWDTGPPVPQPAVVSAGKPMPPPEPTELQRIRAELAARR